MSELPNFPFVNQRLDGNLNHDFDCVPSSLEAGANYLLGKNVIDDSAMKNAIYGAGYVGGTAASAYADYLKARGVHIYPISGAYPDLLNQAHQHLAAGHPVVFTRDDPYAPGHPDWSHVSVWYKDTADSLTAMDPFGAHAVTMTDSEWTQHLRGNEFWIMELIMQHYSEQSADFSSWFTAIDMSHWKCKTTGKTVQFGIKSFYQSLSLDGNSLPLVGLPLSDEINLTVGGKAVVLQVFERAGVWFDPAHAKDKQPGTGSCALCHLADPDFLAHVPGLPAQPAPAPSAPQPALNLSDAIATLQALGTDVATKLVQVLKDLGVS